MPTYISVLEVLGGVYDKGAGYLVDMQWHLEATGAPLGYTINYSSIIPGADPPIHRVPSATPLLISNQHREFHYRFIPIPNPLVLNNPPFGLPIEWRLWNTFPLDDTAVVATISGTSVITSSFSIGTTLWDGEWSAQTITVSEGEVEINAQIFGDFTQGDFTLDIIGVLVLTIDELPVDGTVEESWNWNTKVISSWDATEQRIRYLPAPIRKIRAEYDFDEAQIVDLQQRLYKSSVSTLGIPYWQYEFFLTDVSPVNSNLIFFDPSYTNLKVGDRLYILDRSPSTIVPVIVTIEAMLANGCRITSQLSRQLEPGWKACPFYSIYADKPQFTMDSVTGRFTVSGEVVDRDRELTRDLVANSLTLYKTIPVLDFKILAGITEGYRLELEDLSSPIGRRQRSIIWEQPKLLRSVAFRVNRKKALTNYDYATLFFDYCAGQHKPFFISSRLEDLLLRSQPPNGSSQLEIQTLNYPDTYFDDPIYKQLEIEYLDGTYNWFTVNTAEGQLGGWSLLSLDNALPADVETNYITRISFLYRVRLATDKVSVDFQNNRSTFKFAVLGAAQ
jgi:hypothetical protein